MLGAGAVVADHRIRLPLFPISLRLILGRTSKEIDATEEIWQSTGATV